MNKEDYNEYYIQGSDHYLIPKDVFKELFNEMVNWKEEVKELNKKYLNAVADYETTMSDLQELKKQLEEWITHLIEAKKMLDIQAQQGNYDFDEYMLGIYNGMEYIVSIFENREPEYISGTEVKFINNQQKEFINYLENEKDRLARECSQIYEDSLGHTRLVSEDIFDEVNDILRKYQEIIGVSDEKEN